MSHTEDGEEISYHNKNYHHEGSMLAGSARKWFDSAQRHLWERDSHQTRTTETYEALFINKTKLSGGRADCKAGIARFLSFYELCMEEFGRKQENFG